MSKKLPRLLALAAQTYPEIEWEVTAYAGASVTGKLYAGAINTEIANTIRYASDTEYADMTMTSAPVKELAETGFDAAGDGEAYPYVLVTRGGAPPEDDAAYQIAFTGNSCTGEAGRIHNVQVKEGALNTFPRTWPEEQVAVSPGGNSGNNCGLCGKNCPRACKDFPE